MNKIIQITPIALTKLKNIKISQKCESIKLSVKGGGCNGFNYQLEPYNKPAEKNDEILKFDDLELQVCGYSLFHLFGTKIDWDESIMGSAFTFTNPNASSKCGCGNSFGI